MEDLGGVIRDCQSLWQGLWHSPHRDDRWASQVPEGNPQGSMVGKESVICIHPSQVGDELWRDVDEVLHGGSFARVLHLLTPGLLRKGLHFNPSLAFPVFGGVKIFLQLIPVSHDEPRAYTPFDDLAGQ